ncbi:MAG: hypothetical protein V1905_03105 [bacterium]
MEGKILKIKLPQSVIKDFLITALDEENTRQKEQDKNYISDFDREVNKLLEKGGNKKSNYGKQ